MRALVTVAPFFQDAGNAHAALARRNATSIDTTDWRGCGLYDASYLSKYTLTPEGPACRPGGFCAVSGQFFDCLPYSGGTVRTTCVDIFTLCSNCDNGYYVSCDNIANPYCLTWHFGAAITGWGCGPQRQEGSILSPNLTPWFPPTSGIPTALLTEAAITLVQGTPTFPSSTTSLITSRQSSGVIPTTVFIVTSTLFAVPPTPTRSESARVGVSVGISISALIIIAIAVLI